MHEEILRILRLQLLVECRIFDFLKTSVKIINDNRNMVKYLLFIDIFVKRCYVKE